MRSLPSPKHPLPPTGSAQARPRRGVALVFVLVFVIAMAALAMGSIFMASNANLLAKSYDKERNLRYAAEAALAIGKSRVNADPSVLIMPVGQYDVPIIENQPIIGADNKAIPDVRVNVYVGPTGSMNGQAGRFSSIVAEARDSRNNGFIRRLELTQESFAKFAYWSNDESNGGSIIYFNNGDELWGPVWSNDVIHIGGGGATFHDEVGTSQTISGAGYGRFMKGKQERQKPIRLPSTAQLSKLAPIASASGWNFTGSGSASNYETQLRNRIEFIAADLNGQNDSTDANEGFFRFYTANSGNDAAVRGDWPGSTQSLVGRCGDFHYAPSSLGGGLQFYPASVHTQTWFRDQIKQGYMDALGWTAATALNAANTEQAKTLQAILGTPGARCYLAGDPHLVATDRATTITDPATGAEYTSVAVNRGGTDTTFTPVGLYGSWKQYTNTPADSISHHRPWDAKYLYPIDRGFNTNAKGVIYTDRNVGLSGTLRGQITLYSKGSIVLLDDVRYANDPVKGVCLDMLGLISDRDIVIADNALNTPPAVTAGKKNSKYFSLDDTKDYYLHGVLMALGTAFRVEDYDQGPTDVNDCSGADNGRGCIYLSGGIIQKERGPVGTSSGTGYSKRYSYDHCAVVTPPPYFPTTGRFQDNRYIELDPAGFNDTTYFRTLSPDP
jgi:hypothetical protein